MEMTLHLQQLDHIPPVLYDCTAKDLHQHFDQPTLIHLQGRKKEPLFISVLLHGNETSGLLALQKILQAYRSKELPRSLSIFLGNTAAAKKNRRRLKDQNDYNRVWPGTNEPVSEETRVMQEIVAIMEEKNVFASIDIHNNTGLNPHYACVNVLKAPHLQLANLFSRTIVYFIRPHGTQSGAMSEICPAITIECGKPGEPHGVDHATELIDACLHISEIPDHPPAEHDIAIYHSVARVEIPDHVSFGFDKKNKDLIFHKNLEKLNFQEAAPGTEIAECAGEKKILLNVTNEEKENVTDEFLECHEEKIKIKKPIMLSMLTQDERVIRQDCLCYLMERI